MKMLFSKPFYQLSYRKVFLWLYHHLANLLPCYRCPKSRNFESIASYQFYSKPARPLKIFP